MDANIQMGYHAVMEDRVILRELSYEINGVLFHVHNNLGRFCKEKVYCDAIEHELQDRNILYAREHIVPIQIDNVIFTKNRADFLVEDQLILEIKAKRFVSREDYLQTRGYLAALQKPLGLLVNFQQRFLVPKRVLSPLNS